MPSAVARSASSFSSAVKWLRNSRKVWSAVSPVRCRAVLQELLFRGDRCCNLVCIGHQGRQEIAANHILHGLCFDMDGFAVGLQQNFISGEDLFFGEDVMAGKQVDILLVNEIRKRIRSGL